MSTIFVSEARAALGDILERVHAGEEVTITRHGEAVAGCPRWSLTQRWQWTLSTLTP